DNQWWEQTQHGAARHVTKQTKLATSADDVGRFYFGCVEVEPFKQPFSAHLYDDIGSFGERLHLLIEIDRDFLRILQNSAFGHGLKHGKSCTGGQRISTKGRGV